MHKLILKTVLILGLFISMPVFATLALGTTAPDFTLKDTISGQMKSLKTLKSDKGTVVMFICNHCPFVKHVQKAVVELANEYEKKGIAFIAICSNDSLRYPEDGPVNMKKVAEKLHYPFPYLHDESQKLVKAYQVTNTPTFFVFDKNLRCVYRGQFDNTKPGRQPATGQDLRLTLNALLNNQPISPRQKLNAGCSIKWKKSA